MPAPSELRMNTRTIYSVRLVMRPLGELEQVSRQGVLVDLWRGIPLAIDDAVPVGEIRSS